VLVVDDLAVNRTVLTRLLGDVGFLVREASSGEEAVAAWESWRPHFIWMDKRMPGIDGLEATRRIRAAEAKWGIPRVPIVALSASALEHERAEILAAGCDDFVAKPYRASTVFSKLAQYVGARYVVDDEPDAPPPTPAAAAPGAGAWRVLLVDDDMVCRTVAEELLLQRGLAVTPVSSGPEALEALDAGRFDLVLMDLYMPGMDGPATARRIREQPRFKELPVIAMTSDAFDGERARFAATGMDDYIGKPVEPGALATVLTRWLRRAAPQVRPSS
jgi:two-component system, sensor histidine kinase and response regulator